MATESEKNWIEAIRIEADFHTMHEFKGDGVTDTYEVNFSGGYLNVSHVKGMTLDTETLESTPLNMTLIGRNTFKVSPVPADGNIVTIFRDTPKEVPMLSFVDGAIVTAANLDRNYKQPIFAIAEILDRYNISISEQEDIIRRLLELEGNQEWIKDIKEYFENILNDLTGLKSRTYVYRPVGGESSFVVDLEGAVLALPAMFVNGGRQEVGIHYNYDYKTKTVSEINPGDWQLEGTELIVCMASEGTIPCADLLKTDEGAGMVGSSNGLTVQDNLDMQGSTVNGRQFIDYYSAASAAANVTPITLTFNKPAVTTYFNDIQDVDVVYRNTSTGGSSGFKLTVVTSREGGNATMSIVGIQSRNGAVLESDINASDAPATQVLQVALSNVTPDASAFYVTLLAKSTQSAVFAIRGYLK